MNIFKLHAAAAVCALSASFIANAASAASIVIDFTGGTVYSTNEADGAQTPTGAAAKVTLDFADVGSDVQIKFSIENTTGDVSFGSGATSSTLTGFAMDYVEDMAVVAGSLSLISGKTSAVDTLLTNIFLGGITNGGGGAGNFSFGVADNNNFVGGNANGGMFADESAMVSLLFTTSKTANEIMSAYSNLLFATNPTVNAGLRFQQVSGGANYNGATSDKLLFVPPPLNEVPLPAAAWMLLAGLGGLVAMKRRKAV
jgi:hypothetical protein